MMSLLCHVLIHEGSLPRCCNICLVLVYNYIHHRRKEVESKKHHGTVKESTSEQQRFDWTEITFYLRKNGGYIHSSLGGRSVLVVRQAGR